MPLAVNQNTLDALVVLARQAGEVVMAVYGQDFDVSHKDDQSPVTVADERAEAVIVAGLRTLDASIPIVAEESMAKGQGPDQLGTRFWLVDPLDGTKEFIRRNGEFTVNIALIDHGAPVMGVVYAPALGRLYAGGMGLSACCLLDGRQEAQAIAVRPADVRALVAVASKSHRTPETDAYLNRLPAADSRSAGSSLKFCLVAEGSADIYPRFGPTCEWDTAAGDAVLRAAGGAVVDFSGQPLRYGKANFLNPHFLAHGLVGDVTPYLS